MLNFIFYEIPKKKKKKTSTRTISDESVSRVDLDFSLLNNIESKFISLPKLSNIFCGCL